MTGYLQLIGYASSILEQLKQINEKFQLATVPVTLLHPKSLGSVKLSSNSYLDYPAIDVNYFDHPDDMRTMMRGIRGLIPFLKTKAFKKYKIELIKLKTPDCENLEYKSDAYWECYIKYTSLSVFVTSGKKN